MSNIDVSQADTIGVFGTSLDDYILMRRHFDDDIDWLRNLPDHQKDTESFRRSLIRTVWSIIEGDFFAIRSVLSFFNDVLEMDDALSPSEKRKLFLKNLKKSKDNQGFLERRDSTDETIKTIVKYSRQMLRTYNSGIILSVECSGPDWDLLIRTKGVRNNIIHPKKPSDLFVRKQDVSDCLRVYNWCADTSNKIRLAMSEWAAHVKKFDPENEAIK